MARRSNAERSWSDNEEDEVGVRRREGSQREERYLDGLTGNARWREEEQQRRMQALRNESERRKDYEQRPRSRGGRDESRGMEGRDKRRDGSNERREYDKRPLSRGGRDERRDRVGRGGRDRSGSGDGRNSSCRRYEEERNGSDRRRERRASRERSGRWERDDSEGRGRQLEKDKSEGSAGKGVRDLSIEGRNGKWERLGSVEENGRVERRVSDVGIAMEDVAKEIWEGEENYELSDNYEMRSTEGHSDNLKQTPSRSPLRPAKSNSNNFTRLQSHEIKLENHTVERPIKNEKRNSDDDDEASHLRRELLSQMHSNKLSRSSDKASRIDDGESEERSSVVASLPCASEERSSSVVATASLPCASENGESYVECAWSAHGCDVFVLESQWRNHTMRQCAARVVACPKCAAEQPLPAVDGHVGKEHGVRISEKFSVIAIRWIMLTTRFDVASEVTRFRGHVFVCKVRSVDGRLFCCVSLIGTPTRARQFKFAAHANTFGRNTDIIKFVGLVHSDVDHMHGQCISLGELEFMQANGLSQAHFPLMLNIRIFRNTDLTTDV